MSIFQDEDRHRWRSSFWKNDIDVDLRFGRSTSIFWRFMMSIFVLEDRHRCFGFLKTKIDIANRCGFPKSESGIDAARSAPHRPDPPAPPRTTRPGRSGWPGSSTALKHRAQAPRSSTAFKHRAQAPCSSTVVKHRVLKHRAQAPKCFSGGVVIYFKRSGPQTSICI